VSVKLGTVRREANDCRLRLAGVRRGGGGRSRKEGLNGQKIVTGKRLVIGVANPGGGKKSSPKNLDDIVKSGKARKDEGKAWNCHKLIQEAQEEKWEKSSGESASKS